MSNDLEPPQHGTPPLASVVVPTSGHRDLVERLLAGLSRQTIAPSLFEVVVVADGATDGTVELLEGYSCDYQLLCVSQPRRGRAAARNAAIERATGSLVVMLDDDMQPVEGWLEAHLEAHKTVRRLCVLGAVPVAAQPQSTPLERWVRRNFDEHNAKLEQPGRKIALVDFYSGNTSIRRDVLDEVGGFDEDFSMLYGNEDLELFARLRHAGVEVAFSVDACAVQEYNKTFAVYARDTRDAGRTAVLLARKHPDLADELVQFRGGRGVLRRVDGVLLRVTRRSAIVQRLIVALEAFLARLVPSERLLGFYSFVSMHFFWAGVDEAQGDGTRTLRRS